MTHHERRLHNLHAYGRRHLYAYISDSFYPLMRGDRKYRQWKRLILKATEAARSEPERRFMRSLLEVKIERLQLRR